MKKIGWRFPTIEENLECSEVYDEVYLKAKQAGVLTKNDISSWLRIHDIFTLEMQAKIDEIESLPFIKYPVVPELSKEDLIKNKFLEKCLSEIIIGRRVIKIENLLDFNEEKEPQLKEYKKLSNIKNEYFRYTCEGLADAARIKKLIYFCTLNGDTLKPLWKSYEEFSNEPSDLITLISIKGIEFLSGFSSTILRRIARHSIWRTKWISAIKVGSPVFKDEISTWDNNKTLLCYWSNLYDNVFNSYEKIESFIIEDDERLDNYLEAKAKEKEDKSATTSSGNGDRILFKPIIKKK